jgi:uncharacterized protein DUF6701
MYNLNKHNKSKSSKTVLCFYSCLFSLFTLSVQAASTSISYAVSSGIDDAEERNVTGTPPGGGTMNLDSTDLELVYDGGTRQVVGMRFTGVAIKQGASSITDAYIQFTVDENDSGTTNVVIYGQDADDTLEFGTSNGNITGRTPTTASVSWTSIPTWNGAGTAGTDQRTPNISSIISEIVQRPGWTENSSIVIMIEPDTGCNSSACQRTAESFNGTPAEAPQLVITLDDGDVSSTLNGYPVSQSSDDAEERGAGVPGSAGTMSLTSTDLEHVYDGGTRQVVGMRFQNIAIDQGETGITDAYIQYTVDETDSGTTNVVIYGEDEDDTLTFGSTSGDITGRTPTTASVLWSGIVAWNTAGAAGTDQRTPNISSIISEIVQRPGWTNGNSIVIFIEPGTGCNSTACQRTAESFDGTAPPQLVIVIDPANIILSTVANSTIGGQAIDQDEAVEYGAAADTGSLFLDDATYDTNANTDAIHMLSYGNLVISTAGNEAIGGNAFLDGDLVEVSPTGTPGVYDYVGIYFAESNFTSGNEDIDAVYVRDNGNIVISTDANAQLPLCGGGNLNFGDDDLVEWDIGSNCATSIINFSPLLSACFDSGGGGNTDEDIWGVHYLNDDDDKMLISLRNDCSLDGQNFEDGDIILYVPSTGTASTYLDESNFTSGNEDINALSLALTVTPKAVDHYKIEALTSPGACDPVQIEITAHDETDAPTNVSIGTVLSFSTLTGTSTWGSKLSGTGNWIPTGATATYTWPGGESTVQVELTNVTTVTENINLTDGSATELIGDAVEDPDIDFSSNPIIKITTDGSDDGTIGTDISGKDSDQPPTNQTLYIQLKQSGITVAGQDACEVPGYYNGARNVQIAAECINPDTCAGEQVVINGNPVNTYDTGSVPASTASWTTVSMSFDGTDGVNIDTDNKASLVFNYPDAGQMILYFESTINPAGPPGQTPSRTFAGSSNNFVVRPFGFRIDDFSPTNPAATDGTGGVITKAGQNFTADITAVVWESTDDDGSQPGSTADDGIPDANSDLTGNATTPNFGNESTAVIADISHTLIAPDPAVITGAESGSLTGNGNVPGFASGVIDDHTMSWDEVGIIQLDVNESNNDYLGGGQDITGQIPFLGRFTPANLTVAVNGGTNFEDACTAGSFTYMGQEFYFDPAANDAPRIRVRGVNTSGGITFNYDTTEFFKLDTTTLPRSYVDQSGAAASFDFLAGGIVEYQNLQEDNNPNGNIFLRLQDGSDGDHFTYIRVSEEAPFTGSVDLTFKAAGLIDTDEVCYDGDGDSICDALPPTPLSTDDDFAFGNITGTSQRFGRLNIGTAVGSELLPISVPFQTEYHDGTGFVVNTDDDCTLIDDVSPVNAIPDLILDNSIESIVTDGDIQICVAGGTSTFTLTNPTLVGGDGGLSFSAPGTNCIGYSDISLDLTALGINFLQYDWLTDDGSYDDDPTGRVDFGLFEGPNSFIYIREPW